MHRSGDTIVPPVASSSSSSSFVRRIRESRFPSQSSSASSPHRETHASLLRRAAHLARPPSAANLTICHAKVAFKPDKERIRLLAEPLNELNFNYCFSSSSPAVSSPPLVVQHSSNEDMVYTNISNDTDRLRLVLDLPGSLTLKRRLPYYRRPRTVASSSPSILSIEYPTRYRTSPAGSNTLLHLFEYSSVKFTCFVFNFRMEVLGILDLSTGKLMNSN